MSSVSIDEANRTALMITVFIKDGAQENIGVPASFFPGIIQSIKEKGFQTLHLSNGESLDVTGFLVGGKPFYKESRVIVVEGDKNGRTLN